MTTKTNPTGRIMSRDEVPFPEPRPLHVEVTDDMVLAALNERHRCLGAPAPSLHYYLGSAVDAMRRSLKAALAAAPTPDEDSTVDYHAMWWTAEREREQAERERDDLRASMAELAPAEVCVRGDWFKVSELPEVLGRVMDARDEAQREAKRYYLRAMTPAPVTPEWHSARIVEARVLGGDRCQWASTSNGMWVSLDGSNRPAHRAYLLDATVVVPGEVEA